MHDPKHPDAETAATGASASAARDLFLEELNRVLAPHNDAAYRDLPEAYPQLFIVGTLRSGTTLLSQLCASCLDVGYVSNLAAAFWRAPLFGIRLQQRLIVDRPPSDYASEFGRTGAIHEPHEFGYFWSDWLGFHDQQRDESFTVDWPRLRTILNNLAHETGRPFVHKTLLLYAFVGPLLEEMQRSWVAVVHRDVVETAMSVLDMRRRKHGSSDAWGSLRIPAFERLLARPWWEQIAAQVHHMQTTIANQLADVPHERVIELSYRRLCRDPSGVLDELVERVSRSDVPLARRHRCPQSFVYRRRPDDDDRRRLRAALESLYDGKWPDRDR